MSIKTRTAIITAAFTFMASAMISAFTLSAQRAQLTAEAKRKVELAVMLVADMSEAPLRDGNLFTLTLVADRIAQGPPSDVSIADRKGIILVDSAHVAYDKTNSVIQSTRKSNQTTILRRGNYWLAAAPVKDYAGRLIGVVYMTISSRPLQQALDHLTRMVLALAALFIVIGILLSYVFGVYISGAFAPLLIAIRKSTSGNIGSRAPIVGVSELDEVGRSFNRMSFLIERRMRDLERLNHMSVQMSAARNVEELADSVSETCSLLVPKGACRVITGDPSGGILTIVGEEGGIHRVTPACAATTAIKEHTTLSIGVDAELAPGTQVAEGVKPQSAIVAPLVTAEQSVGIILVTFDPADTPSPRREDIESVATIANLTSSPLASIQRMKAQEQAVGALRDILLPESVPVLSGVSICTRYEPADKPSGFGGDYYDFIPIDEHLLGIAVGDVSGHGLDAGRYTAMAKYALRSYALESGLPDHSLARANASLTVQMAGVVFISVFFGILDLERHTFTYSCAGHPPGLVYSGRRGDIQELDVGGSVLGIDPQASFVSDTVTLEAGDLLVLYTDGVIEARAQGELYGMDRLKAVVSRNTASDLPDIAEAIIEGVREFTGDQFLDDVALVLIRPEE